MDAILALKSKLCQMWPHLNERSKRMVAAAEAVQLGYGGISRVSRACGLSRVTITKRDSGAGRQALGCESDSSCRRGAPPIGSQ